MSSKIFQSLRSLRTDYRHIFIRRVAPGLVAVARFGVATTGIMLWNASFGAMFGPEGPFVNGWRERSQAYGIDKENGRRLHEGEWYNDLGAVVVGMW